MSGMAEWEVYMAGLNRHVYLGANTRKGFRGVYHQLLRNDDCRVYILKGGPGTGKSTFIKKVISELQGYDFCMDIIHCSGDPTSLDGVICTEAGVIVVDGTSPHTLDPAIPGAREEIINLGAFWDSAMLRKFQSDIAQYNEKKAAFYRRAYQYLAAAGAIYDDSNTIVESCVEKDKMHFFAQKLASEILYDIDESIHWGKDTAMFATAITPGGMQGDVGQIFREEKVYSVKTFYGIHASQILKTVRSRALACGFDTESFYCGFDSDILEHLLIPDLGVAIVTSNDYHEADGHDAYFDYPLEGFLCEYSVYPVKDDLKYNKIRFDELMDKAIRSLFKARQIHGEIEEIYVAAMDFDSMDQYLDTTLQRITADIL